MKILVSDFDDTLYTINYLKNIEKIQEFVNNENMFIIATGRNYTQLLEDIEDYYVPYFFLICDDGAGIYSRKGEVLFKKYIDKDIALDIFETLRNNKEISEAYFDTGEEYLLDASDKAIKIIGKPKDIKKSKDILNNILAKYPQVQGYISENWINITDKEVNKATGIDFILEKYNLDGNSIFVVGDNINDIPMFNKYNGFCIGNKNDDLLSISTKVCTSIEDVINEINVN